MGELVEALRSTGLSGVHVVGSFDPFRGTRKEKTTRHFRVRGVNVVAVRPGG